MDWVNLKNISNRFFRKTRRVWKWTTTRNVNANQSLERIAALDVLLSKPYITTVLKSFFYAFILRNRKLDTLQDTRISFRIIDGIIVDSFF
jgi:hypothetical protein